MAAAKGADRQLLADHPGGADLDQFVVDPQRFGSKAGGLPRRRHPLRAGTGIGNAGIDQDGLGPAGGYPLHIEQHRGGLDLAGGKDPGRRGRSVS